MPKGTLAQESSTCYAKGNTGSKVFNTLCQREHWRKGLQHAMPKGTLALRSLTTQCSMLKTIYIFQSHAHAFGTQCSHKTPMFQPVFFTTHNHHMSIRHEKQHIICNFIKIHKILSFSQ
jgi:hypothetical protein